MKTSLPIIITVCLLAGCGEKSNPPAPPGNTPTNNAPSSNAPTKAEAQPPASSGGLLTAPVDYLAAAARAEQSAVKTVDVASLSHAIQQFNVEEGRYPKDLNELVELKYYPKIPPVPYGMKLAYDANLGQVKVVKQ
jgi:hypothetical protein